MCPLQIYAVAGNFAVLFAPDMGVGETRKGGNTMKKMMTLAIGLSLLTGSALFGAGRPAPRANDRGRNEARNDKRRQDDRRGAQRDRRVDQRGKR
jgi:hypothetical protein